MNYFVHPSAAGRYTKDRPYFRPLVVERVRRFLQLRRPVSLAVDVGCGTGMSSRALLEIANVVIGIDPSRAMLAEAAAHPRIHFVQASAERLPIEPAGADLVCVTLAFHWFDRGRFLAEAHRVLRDDGTLVIASHGFRSWLLANTRLTDWFRDEYFPRFPKPPRNEEPFPDEAAREHGFGFLGRETFRHEIPYSPEQLAANLATHSNVIVAVEEGNQSVDEITAWIVESVRPLFSKPTEDIVFVGEIWYLRPIRG